MFPGPWMVVVLIRFAAHWCLVFIFYQLPLWRWKMNKLNVRSQHGAECYERLVMVNEFGNP